MYVFTLFLLDELLYADDMAKYAPTEKKMQEDMDRVSQASQNQHETASTWNAQQQWTEKRL